MPEPASDARTGSFATALGSAIERSGRSLADITQELSARGVAVSATTLGYWLRGRSRPERPASLDALRVLERDILRLPDGTLRAHLGPKRPRGRWLRHSPGAPDLRRLWPDAHRIRGLMETIGDPQDDRIVRLSQQDICQLGPDRDETLIRCRLVLRAAVDQVRHFVAVYHADPGAVRLPTLRVVYGASVARVCSDLAAGLVVADLAFPRPMRLGETVLLDYELTYAGGSGAVAHSYDRRFRFPAREFGLLVRFAPDAVPARCFTVLKNPDDRVTRLRPLPFWDACSVQLVRTDVLPGIHGVSWEW
jgi:hypothetical protein